MPLKNTPLGKAKAKWFRHEFVCDYYHGEPLCCEMRQRESKFDNWEVAYKSDGKLNWQSMGTDSFQKAVPLAVDFVATQLTHNELIQSDRQQRVIDGIARLSANKFWEVKRAVDQRAAFIIGSQVGRLLREHDLNVVEQDYVGIVMLRKQVAAALAALEVAEKRHGMLVKANSDNVRNEKCEAVAEQVDAIKIEELDVVIGGVKP